MWPSSCVATPAAPKRSRQRARWTSAVWRAKYPSCAKPWQEPATRTMRTSARPRATGLKRIRMPLWFQARTAMRTAAWSGPPS
jgi:hypothetical protein